MQRDARSRRRVRGETLRNGAERFLVFRVKPNIDAQGRKTRGGFGILFLLFAGCLFPVNGTLSLVFLLVGLFSLFEAWKGWCAVRACGIKTPF